MAIWFTYNGLPASTSDPASYLSVGDQPTTCSGTNQVCAIFANSSTNGLPIITEQIQADISTALNSRTDVPGKVLLKA